MDVLRAARDRWFRWVLRNQLIYASCWEDSRVDREALRIGTSDRVLVITSGGCNALAYALDAPRRIYAVDVNYRQNALLELKLAGIRTLDHETFFAFFGRGYYRHATRAYRRLLRPELADAARQYWDREIWKFADRRRSFYYRGGVGTGAWWFRLYVDRVVRLRPALDRLFAAETPSEQAEIYRRQLRDRFWSPAARRVLNNRLMLAMAGVPESQWRHARRAVPDVAGHLDDCAARLLERMPLGDNHFWQVYVHGCYTPACCPDYLKPEHFKRLQHGLADRIEVHTGSVEQFLAANDVRISRFALLDHLDWHAGGPPEALRRTWEQLLSRAAPRSRFVWRSMGRTTDFIDDCRVAYRGTERPVGDWLEYDAPLATRLRERERVNAYSGLFVAQLREDLR